jgi:hypothetical protein
LIDRVDFEQANNDLAGDYYIGVVGYQESSFELKCVPQRSGQSEWDVMEGNSFDRYYQLLADGYPKQGELHDETAADKYRIEVKMEAGFERAILIEVTDADPDHDVMVFISYRKDPTAEEGGSDFAITSQGNKHVEIPVGSEHYHAKGTYYIMVMPMNSDLASAVWRYFTDDYYSYTIKYSLAGSIEFLGYDTVTQCPKQGANTLRKYRYIVADPTVDQKISLNMYQGAAVLKTSLYMADILTTSIDDHDGAAVQTGKSASYIIRADEVDDPANPQCQDEIDPCVVYVGVKCLAGEGLCQYSLKVSDPNSGPQKVLIGTPSQDSVE